MSMMVDMEEIRQYNNYNMNVTTDGSYRDNSIDDTSSYHNSDINSQAGSKSGSQA